MRDLVGGSTDRSTSLLFTLIVAATVAVAACSGSGGGSPSTASAAAGGAAAASTDTSGGGGPASGGGAGGGDATVTGSIKSSGAYDATWTWQAPNAAGPGVIGITLKSDKGTFGSLSVLPDGSITFTSAAPELSAGSYAGTGAQVTMKNSAPCSFTLDNDVTGGGQTLHLKGSLAINGGAFC